MSESEDRPPAPESRDAYVSAIMQQDAEDRARETQRLRKRGARYLAPLLVILVVVIGWNLTRVLETPRAFTPAEELAAARFTIYLVAQGLEAYRDSVGTLPTDLESAGLDEEGLVYTVRDSAYTLEFTGEGEVITYRSGEDLGPYAAAYDAGERGAAP